MNNNNIINYILITVFVFNINVLFLNPAYASSCSRMRFDLHTIKDSIFFYYKTYQVYPVNDENSTWYDKIVAGGILSRDSLDVISSDIGYVPVDIYGRPIIYECTDPYGNASKSLQDIIHIRSVGRDGIDNNGGGDDWDVYTGPNWGYWCKKYWPEATVIFSCGIIFSICMIIFYMRWLKRWHKGKHVIASGILFLYSAMGFILPQLIDTNLFTSSNHLSKHWRHVVGVALLCMVLSTIICIFYLISEIRHKHVCAIKFICPSCGYSLIGLSSRKCPECGNDI